MIKALDEIENIVSLIKVKIHELEKENRKLKKQIKRLHDELKNFVNLNKITDLD